MQSSRSWRTHTGLGSVDNPRRRTRLFPIITSQLIFESTLPQLRRQQLAITKGSTLDQMVCYLILSYPILSYPILSESYLILSCLFLSYLSNLSNLSIYSICIYLYDLHLSLHSDLFGGQFLIGQNITSVAHQLSAKLTRNATMDTVSQ